MHGPNNGPSLTHHPADMASQTCKQIHKLGFSHTRVHTLRLTACVCKKLDEMRRCVNPVTRQRGRVFETAPQRGEKMLRKCLKWDLVRFFLSTLPLEIYLLSVSSHYVQSVFYNKFELSLLSHAHRLCQDLPAGECRSVCFGVRVLVQISLQLDLKSFLSC